MLNVFIYLLKKEQILADFWFFRIFVKIIILMFLYLLKKVSIQFSIEFLVKFLIF